MRIVFVYYLMNKGGSAQDVYHYTRAAKMLGHEVVVYGVQPPDSPFSLSREIDSADAVFFIFEWTQALRYRGRAGSLAPDRTRSERPPVRHRL